MIAGLGRYLPERRVGNVEVGQLCGRSSAWIGKRTGVLERRWVLHETAPQMGAEAAREAIERARVAWEDIDLILHASGTPAQALPDGGALVQRELGLRGVAAFSIHATCLSFLVGLHTAWALIKSGAYRNILLVSTEVTSGSLNFADPYSCALFGDGAAAAVIQGPGDLTYRLETYGEGAGLTQVRGGGSLRHPSRCAPEDNLFSMDGPAVLRMACGILPGFLERLRPGLSQTLAGVDWVIPHQASVAGLAILERFNWPRERVVSNLASLGNTVAASIPLALYEAVESGRLRRGDEILLLGTGAGFSLGGALLRY